VYPLLMRYLGRLLFGRGHSHAYLAGIVIAWVSFVLAMIVLYHLARLDLPRRAAERAVALTALFPFAFFFGVAYSESTFLLFTLLAFYRLRTGRWLSGGLAAGLAGATRVNGILMWPALAWTAWRSARGTPHDRWRAVAALVLGASGFAAYCIYIYAVSGHPFLWMVALERWGYHPGGLPWRAPARLVFLLMTHPYAYLLSDRMALYDALNGVTAIGFTLALPLIWKRLGTGYALFMLTNLWVPLSSGGFEGMGRYCAVLFPCFIWLAGLRSRLASTTVLAGFAMLYTLCLALFTNIHPLF